MILGWENPLFWCLGGTAAVLLVLYWFQRKGTPFYTSTLFLWEDELSESKLSSRLIRQKLP